MDAEEYVLHIGDKFHNPNNTYPHPCVPQHVL